MPLYRCTVAEGLTTFEQRSLISKEITRIHCEITGAPPEFVHAFFAEDADGQLPDGQQAFVLGSIHLPRACGHLVAGSTIDQIHLLKTDPAAGSCNVHGNISPATD